MPAPAPPSVGTACLPVGREQQSQDLKPFRTGSGDVKYNARAEFKTLIIDHRELIILD
jgi:hypothetical protein